MISTDIQSVKQLVIALRDARIIAGMSQTELSRRTGIPRPWINQFEQGNISNPGLQRILTINAVLHVTLTAFYETTATQQPTPTALRQAGTPTAASSDIDSIFTAIAQRAAEADAQAAALNATPNGKGLST